MTIAIAAPPQSDSLCGRYGTSSRCSAAAGACAGAEGTGIAAVRTAAMTRRVSIRECNNQNNEKQYDDDGRRRDHYRARAARQIVLHLPRLLGGLLQVLSLQSGRRRLGPVERETGLRCDLAHFRALQQGPDCLAVRLFLADTLL